MRTYLINSKPVDHKQIYRENVEDLSLFESVNSIKKKLNFFKLFLFGSSHFILPHAMHINKASFYFVNSNLSQFILILFNE